jgi:hypothetical protein
MRQHFVSLEKHIGPPLRAGNHVIRLEARSLRLTVPGAGSLIWTRAVSVQVQSPGGEERIIPVRDVTRWVELTLWAAPALLALTAAIMSIAARRARRRSLHLQGVSHEQRGSIQSVSA